MKNIITRIAIFLSQFEWAKKFFKPIYHKFYIEYLQKRIKKNFQNHGIEVLSKFDMLMKEYNINYSLTFGTLLGAIREKGFIKHDFDIDIAIWYDTDFQIIENILLQNGFKLQRRIVVDNGISGREETYIYKNVSIDLFYFYPYNDKLMYCNVFLLFEGCKSWEESIRKYGGALPLKLILPLEKTVKYIPFENIFLPVPTNAIDFIEARYGKNWKTPDPTFVYPKMGDALYEYCYDKIGVFLINNN